MSEKKKDSPKLSVKEQNLTYKDYAAVDDGNRYEQVNGQLELMTPAPSVTHPPAA